jgi:hypothetical protein
MLPGPIQIEGPRAVANKWDLIPIILSYSEIYVVETRENGPRSPNSSL